MQNFRLYSFHAVKAERLEMLQPQISVELEQFLIIICILITQEVMVKAPRFSVLYLRLGGSGFPKKEQETYLWPVLKGPYKQDIFFHSLTYTCLPWSLEMLFYIALKYVSLLSFVAVNFLFTQ